MISPSSIELHGPALGEAVEHAPPLPVHQLLPPPGDFTGRRKELDELLDKVTYGGAAIAAIYGMGGAGKTALALKLAEELTPRYPDAQFYFDLKGTSSQPLPPVAAMAHVVRAYDPAFTLPEREAEVEGMYRSVLNGKRAIVLMDNAADRDQVLPLIPPESCLLLVTSRNHFALPGIFVKDLDVLPPDHARELLLKIASRFGDLADETAKLCGYLPLAIRQAGSTLAEHRDLSPEDYLQQLSNNGDRRELVEASLALSYDQLTPELQRLWLLLVVFPGWFDAAAARTIWGVEETPARSSLSALLSRNMLEWSDARKRYRMHDLMRLCAGARLAPGEHAFVQKKHAAYYTTVLESANQEYIMGGDGVTRGLGLFDLERENIEAGWSWAAAHAAGDAFAEQLCARFPVVGMDILHLRHLPRERQQWLDLSLASARRMNDRRTGTILLGIMGVAYHHLGEIRRAIECHEESLAIAREVGDRQTEERGLNQLGRALTRLGESRRAIEFHEQALAIARAIGDRRGEGEGLAAMAGAHHAAGEVRRAIELCEQALAIVLGAGDRKGEGDVLGTLAAAYYALGEGRRALELGGQSLAIAREIGNRHEEETALGVLGRSYAMLGDIRRSIESHNAQLTIARAMGDRPGEGNALGYLGNAAARSGDVRRALEYYQDHLKLAREIGDRRGEAIALGNVGRAHTRLGETRRAIESHAEQLRIAREIGDRRTEASALWNTSLALEKLGDRLQATTHAEAAAVIFEESNDSDAARVRKQLADWGEKGKKN